MITIWRFENTKKSGKLLIFGVGLEVNFFGTDDATDHSFHNTDRFMRQAGYDLFGLTVRRYSMAALPSRSKFSFQAETEFGRPLQGDALYVRDVCAPGGPGGWSAAKLAKAAALFALGDLPDCAAEVLATHGPTLSSLFNVQQGLDLLAQSVRRPGMLDNYAGFRARFERDDPCFYTSPPPIIEASGTAVSDARVAVLERERAALRGSTSWRLTAPLRGLMRALRGGP